MSSFNNLTSMNFGYPYLEDENPIDSDAPIAGPSRSQDWCLNPTPEGYIEQPGYEGSTLLDASGDQLVDPRPKCPDAFDSSEVEENFYGFNIHERTVNISVGLTCSPVAHTSTTHPAQFRKISLPCENESQPLVRGAKKSKTISSYRERQKAKMEEVREVLFLTHRDPKKDFASVKNSPKKISANRHSAQVTEAKEGGRESRAYEQYLINVLKELYRSEYGEIGNELKMYTRALQELDGELAPVNERRVLREGHPLAEIDSDVLSNSKAKVNRGAALLRHHLSEDR